MTMKFVAAALAACVFGASAASAAPLTGDTIQCMRNGVNGCVNNSAVVGAGVEFSQGAGTFDFNANGVTLTLSSGPFVNPLNYSFTDTTSPFSMLGAITVSGGSFDPALVTLNNGVLNFALSGFKTTAGTQVSVNLTTGAVPEPATWAMMIVGFGAVGFAMRRRLRASDVKFTNRIKQIAAGELA